MDWYYRAREGIDESEMDSELLGWEGASWDHGGFHG